MSALDNLTLSTKRKRDTMPLSVQVADLTPPRNSDDFEGGHTTPTHADSPRTMSMTGNLQCMYLNETTETTRPNTLECQKHHCNHNHHYTPRKRLRLTPPPQEGEQESENEIVTSLKDLNPLIAHPNSHETTQYTPSYSSRPATPPPSNLPSLPPSPNTPSPFSGQRSLKRKKSPPPDKITNPLTWRDSEITGHLLTDPDDDGTGINGIGFKPTPAVAYARAQKRKQQVAEWRAREARDARQRRSERRRCWQHEAWSVPDPLEGYVDAVEGGELGEFETEKRSRVRFA